MQLGQLKVSPQELAWGMLVALGIVIIIRDVLRAVDQIQMVDQAQPYLADPNKLAEEALDHLGQPGHQREEDKDG